jgi:glycine oxidase
VKGQILTLRGSAERRVCERIVASERVYVVPRADGQVVVGATVEERGFDIQVTAGGVHELLREAYRALPDVAELELLETAAGLRPGTPDNAPLVGPGALDGLVLATGHYRNGMLLAPLTADAIAAFLSGDPLPPEIQVAHPGRFAGERGAGLAAAPAIEEASK